MGQAASTVQLSLIIGGIGVAVWTTYRREQWKTDIGHRVADHVNQLPKIENMLAKVEQDLEVHPGDRDRIELRDTLRRGINKTHEVIAMAQERRIYNDVQTCDGCGELRECEYDLRGDVGGYFCRRCY